MAGGVVNVPLPKELKGQIAVANATLAAYEYTENPVIAGIVFAVAEAIQIIPLLISAFSGVPRNQKTIETGARLVHSKIQAVQLLGLWWYKAGQLGIVDSSPPDIQVYFTPAFNYTISTLNIPFASPLWYGLAGIIGEGQEPEAFDAQFDASNLAKPMFITTQAWNILYPGQRYPQELVTLYEQQAPLFVNPPQDQKQPPPPPSPPPPIIIPPGGQNGGDGNLTAECCKAIVTAIDLVATTIANLTAEPGLGDMKSIVAVVTQIATQLGVIVNAISTLMSTFGQGASSLVDALVAVANSLNQTTINVAGEEVNALNAVSAALVNALGRIDVDTENSLAGVAHAVSNLELSKLIKAIKDCCDESNRDYASPELRELLVKKGLLDATMNQLLGDSPKVKYDIGAALDWVLRFLEGDPTTKMGAPEDWAKQAYKWLKEGLNTAEGEADLIVSTLEGWVKSHAHTLTNLLTSILEFASKLVERIPQETLNALMFFVKRKGAITPENSEGIGFEVLGLGFIIGQIIHLAMGQLNRLGYPASALFSHNAEITIGALGYEEILRQIHRSFFPNAFGRSQNYFYQAHFRPLLPDAGRAMELFARRKIDGDQLNTLLAYNGINAHWAPAMVEAAHRPLQPRAIAQAIGEYKFDKDKLTDLLQFNGLRDQDIEVMIQALEQRGLQPLRQALINETVALAGQGLLSDQDVSSTLHGQNLSDEAIHLINLRIGLLRLHTLALLNKTELIDAAKNEQITLDEFAADLQAVGYQDAEVEVYRNTVDQFVQAKHGREEARKLTLEEARSQRLALKNAQQGFKRGMIDEAGFAAELAASGMSPAQVAAYTQLAAVSEIPVLRVGTALSATAQKQASAKAAIKAISEEYKKSLIDEVTLRAGLTANAMSPQDVDAEVAYLNALITKKPSAAAAPVSVPLAS